MLEELNDLISTLCTDSSIVREMRENRLFFTDDGLIFDSFWESNDYFKFARSEHPSFGGGYLWTHNPTIAQYQLVIGLIPNEGGWRGWRVGLGVGVEVFT